jgi:type II secretory pathway component HofQ
MKKQILISLFLFTVFCAVPVFAQSNSSGEEKLVTELVRLKNLKLKVVVFCIGREKDVDPGEYEKTEKFIGFLRNLASPRGSIETESRSNTLIITDSESQVKIIADFVKLLDEAGFTLKEVVNSPNSEIK